MVNDGSARRSVSHRERGDVPVHGRGREQGRLVEPARSQPVAVSAAAPRVPTVSATEGDTQSVLTFGRRRRQRGDITGYEYAERHGSSAAAPRPRPDHRADATVRTTVPGPGPERRRRRPGQSASNTIKPYGNPPPPVSASVNGQTINWSWSASNGNGRTVDHYEGSLDGGGWQTQDGRRSSGLRLRRDPHAAGPGRVTAADANRRRSDIGTAQRTTVNAPEPVIRATRTGSTSCDSDPSSTCTEYAASGSDLSRTPGTPWPASSTSAAPAGVGTSSPRPFGQRRRELRRRLQVPRRHQHPDPLGRAWPPRPLLLQRRHK